MHQLETIYGTICVPDTERDLIGRFLATYGEWSMLEVIFLGKNLQPDARVLDLGAFVGTFSLGLALHSKLQFVCAVEANPRVASLLSSNLEQNLHVPYAIEIAIVAPPGRTLGIGHFENENLGSLSYSDNADGTESIGPVASTNLAELRDVYGPFDLIKMDIEGMELELIQSDIEALKADCNLALWVECNDTADSLEIADAMLALPHRGLYYFAWPADNPNSANRVTQAILPFAYEAGLLSAKPQPQFDTQLESAGCQFARVHNREELRRAMWSTPRWAPAAWWQLSRPTLVAQAGHDVLGEQYEEYLTPTWVADFAERSAHTKLAAGLARAETLAFERFELLEQAELRISELEGALHEAKRSTFERLAEVQIARANAERIEGEFATLQLRLLSTIDDHATKRGPGSAS